MKSYPEAVSDNFIAKWRKVADFYDGSSLKDIFIEGVDASIRHSLRNRWISHPQVEVTDIAFHADFFLILEKGSRSVATSSKGESVVKQFQRKFWIYAVANNVSTEILPSPKHKSHTRSQSPPVFHIQTHYTQTTTISATTSLSSSMPSAHFSRCDICYGTAHKTPVSPQLSRNNCIYLALARCSNTVKSLEARPWKHKKSSYIHRSQRRSNNQKINSPHPTETLTLPKKHTEEPLLRKHRAGRPVDGYPRETILFRYRTVRNSGFADCTKKSKGSGQRQDYWTRHDAYMQMFWQEARMQHMSLAKVNVEQISSQAQRTIYRLVDDTTWLPRNRQRSSLHE